MVESFGVETILEVTEHLIEDAETQARARIADLPDGSYSFVDYIDDDGVDRDEPVRLEATVEVDGSNVHVDFTGSSDQVKGPINSVPATTMSTVYYMMSAIATPEIRPNAGTFEPVSAHLTAGSILNPTPPAPVNARAVTLKRLVDVLLGAFAKAAPDKIPAAGLRPFATLGFGGQGGDGWVFTDFVAGGSGGRPTADGADTVHKDISNRTSPLAEPTEMEFPLRIHCFELWQDSGGPGKYRGGLGCHKRIEVLSDDVTFTHRCDRFTSPPWGIEGGEAAPRGRSTITDTSGELEALPSKTVRTLDRNEVVGLFVPRGGGYGQSAERTPEAIRGTSKGN